MSNEMVVTAARTSSGDRPGSFRIELRKLHKLPCDMATPFGLPVEPEV